MVFHCTDDYSELEKVSEKWVVDNNKGVRMRFPMYRCTICGRKYTNLYPYPDSMKTALDGTEYVNILPRADEARYDAFLRRGRKISKGTKCYVYEGEFSRCCFQCGRKSYRGSGAVIQIGEAKKVIPLLVCKKCKCQYIRAADYRKNPSYWKPYNIDALSDEPKRPKYSNTTSSSAVNFEKEWIENTGLLQRSGEAEKTISQQNEQAGREAEAQIRDISDIKREWIENTEILSQLRGKDDLGREQTSQNSKRPSQTDLQSKLQEEKSSLSLDKKQRQRPSDMEGGIALRSNNIEAKDFVVRRSAFKCRYKEHSLQNIEGLIQIIDRKGNVCQVRVPAGYCANCDTFFIMESVYQSLKLKGIPVCRVSDENAYLSGNMFANGMQLAQESVLMQYGYSVSQEEGLTNAARRKILALIVDHKILTKNEIIGYLDFFISQRKNQSRYERAIDKWKQDREFISEYRTGEFEQYGVNGLFRKY